MKDYKIGTAIKNIRNKKKISIEDIANMTGISIPSLYSIESNRRTPNFDTIRKISEALDYPVAALMLKAIQNDEIATKYFKIMETLEII